MRSRKLKLFVLLLVMAIASTIGAVVVATAATCVSFGASANPNPGAPDGTVTLQATGFHDQFFNCIPGATLDVFVKRPGDAGFIDVGDAVTDTNGAASFNYSDTTRYDGYLVEFRWQVDPAIKAGTSFSILPGPGAGTFTIDAGGPAPVTIVAGNSTTLNASGIKDSSNKPVHNGTTVSWTLTGPATRNYSATTTGVANSSDTAVASKLAPGADLTVANGPLPTDLYDLSATADAATASLAGALKIVPATVTSLLATAPANIQAGSSAVLGASNAKDQYNNAAWNTSFTFELKDADNATSNYGPEPADAAGAAGVLVPFNNADQRYGVYSWKATATGGASNTTTTNVQPGLAALITNAVASPLDPIAGKNFDVLVNGIKDANGYAAKNGTVVGLSITGPTGPGSFTQSFPNQTVANVDSGQDNAGVTFPIPGLAITSAGEYTGTVTADGATKNFTFEVLPDVAVVDMVVTAGDIVVGAANSVTVTGIPSTATNLQLRVTRPDTNSFTKEVQAPCNPTTNVCSFGGQATVNLTANELDQLGLYGLSARARNSANVPVGIGTDTFNIAARTLSLSLSTAPNPQSANVPRTVTVTNLPPNARSAVLTINRPNGTTITKTNLASDVPGACDPVSGFCSFPSGTTTFQIAGTELNHGGTYQLNASGRNAGNGSIAAGTSSITVKLGVTAPHVDLGAGNVVTVAAVPSNATSVVLDIVRPDLTSFSASGTATGGVANIPLLAADLSQPGLYSVTASAKVGASVIANGTGSFRVAEVPDALAITFTPSSPHILSYVDVTGTATMGGNPVANRALDFRLIDPLGRRTGHFIKATAANGQASVRFAGNHMLVPGEYRIEVRDVGSTLMQTATVFIL